MNTAATTSITVRVPIAVRRRAGRKVIVTPDGAAAPGGTAVPTRGDPALVKALARAHRWRRLVEGGPYRSLWELAEVEGVDRSYVGRVLHLTLLAPDIVEAILDGQQSQRTTLPALMDAFAAEWDQQRAEIGWAARPVRRQLDPEPRGNGTCSRPPAGGRTAKDIRNPMNASLDRSGAIGPALPAMRGSAGPGRPTRAGQNRIVSAGT